MTAIVVARSREYYNGVIPIRHARQSLSTPPPSSLVLRPATVAGFSLLGRRGLEAPDDVVYSYALGARSHVCVCA